MIEKKQATAAFKKHGRVRNRFPIFQERFKLLRGNIPQDEFAKKIGVSRPTVGFYENGERLPDALVLKKISENLNVSVDYLLGIDVENKLELENKVMSEKIKQIQRIIN